MKTKITIISLVGLITTIAGVAIKKPYQQEKTFIASDGVVLGHFGHAIAVDGSRVFISSKAIGNLENKVYINELKTASVPITIVADPSSNNKTSVVSSNTQSSTLNWYETEWLRSVPMTAGFGNSLAAFNNQLFIGSPQDSINKKFENAGSVAIYQLDDADTAVTSDAAAAATSQDATATSTKPKIPKPTKLIQTLQSKIVNANFGCSVSVQGDGMIIGAKGVQANAGRAMIYQRGSDDDIWVPKAVLRPLPSVINTKSLFGDKVTVTSTKIIVTAPDDSVSVPMLGAVYIYDREWYLPPAVIATAAPTGIPTTAPSNSSAPTTAPSTAPTTAAGTDSLTDDLDMLRSSTDTSDGNGTRATYDQRHYDTLANTRSSTVSSSTITSTIMDQSYFYSPDTLEAADAADGLPDQRDASTPKAQYTAVTDKLPTVRSVASYLYTKARAAANTAELIHAAANTADTAAEVLFQAAESLTSDSITSNTRHLRATAPAAAALVPAVTVPSATQSVDTKSRSNMQRNLKSSSAAAAALHSARVTEAETLPPQPIILRPPQGWMQQPFTHFGSQIFFTEDSSLGLITAYDAVNQTNCVYLYEIQKVSNDDETHYVDTWELVTIFYPPHKLLNKEHSSPSSNKLIAADPADENKETSSESSSSSTESDSFGASLVIYKNSIIAIGAPGEDPTNQLWSEGCVYIYKRLPVAKGSAVYEWIYIMQLKASTSAAAASGGVRGVYHHNRYGHSLAVHQDSLLVGADLADSTRSVDTTTTTTATTVTVTNNQSGVVYYEEHFFTAIENGNYDKEESSGENSKPENNHPFFNAALQFTKENLAMILGLILPTMLIGTVMITRHVQRAHNNHKNAKSMNDSENLLATTKARSNSTKSSKSSKSSKEHSASDKKVHRAKLFITRTKAMDNVTSASSSASSAAQPEMFETLAATPVGRFTLRSFLFGAASSTYRSSSGGALGAGSGSGSHIGLATSEDDLEQQGQDQVTRAHSNSKGSSKSSGKGKSMLTRISTSTSHKPYHHSTAAALFTGSGVERVAVDSSDEEDGGEDMEEAKSDNDDEDDEEVAVDHSAEIRMRRLANASNTDTNTSNIKTATNAATIATASTQDLTESEVSTSGSGNGGNSNDASAVTVPPLVTVASADGSAAQRVSWREFNTEGRITTHRSGGNQSINYKALSDAEYHDNSNNERAITQSYVPSVGPSVLPAEEEQKNLTDSLINSSSSNNNNIQSTRKNSRSKIVANILSSAYSSIPSMTLFPTMPAMTQRHKSKKSKSNPTSASSTTASTSNTNTNTAATSTVLAGGIAGIAVAEENAVDIHNDEESDNDNDNEHHSIMNPILNNNMPQAAAEDDIRL